MGQLGFPELLIIGIIALLVFGPKKLPELGSGLGKAIRDFKHAVNDTGSDLQRQNNDGHADQPLIADKSPGATANKSNSSEMETTVSKDK